MKKRCMGCMCEYEGEYNVCPVCGYIEGTPAEEAIHIQPGTRLRDRYTIGKVLGYGGFGVTYIGWDDLLQQKVAIKEYLPTEFSTRIPGQMDVTVFNGDKAEQYKDGLDKFVDEAKRLAKFKNESGIVKVFDSFVENGTAYIIMEYLDGETLSDYLKREGLIPEDKAIEMLMPVMESLQVVHSEGILHRDIAPDNIFLTNSGEVKLIDFGASRYATTSHSRSLTVIIKPGYSPEEQYRSRGDQGPHTDVYALGAVLYKMITGKTPPDAMERRAKYENQNKDILAPLHKMAKRIQPNREIAILNALNVRIEDRTPDIATLISELTTDGAVKRKYGKIKKIDLYSWPIWTKVVVPTAAVALCTFGILIATGVIQFASLFSESIVVPEGIAVVPEVERVEYSRAERDVQTSNLIAQVVGNVESEYVEPGLVIIQSPMGGTYMNANSVVELKVSAGRGEVIEAENGIATMPFIIGSTEEEAIKKLLEAGFAEPNIVEEYSDSISKGLVVSTSLAYLSQIDEGSVIDIVISLGSKPFEMPDSNETPKVEDYLKILEENHLKYTIEYQSSDTVAEGMVISQSIKAGKMVQQGDEVVLIVSAGKDDSLVKVPDLVNHSIEDAKSVLAEAGFKVNTFENYDDNVAQGNVISTTPSAGSMQKKGAAINVYVSKGKTPIIVTLDARGGKVSSSKLTVYYGSTYGDIPDASMSGYTFEGWYTSPNGGTRITSSSKVSDSNNHTLFAQWNGKKYTVSFDSDGGSSNPSSIQVQYMGSYGYLPNVTRVGYSFDGWYTSSGERIRDNDTYKITNDQKLTAKWTPNTYEVYFECNEGTVTKNSMTVTYEKPYGTLATAVRTGYTFAGWYDKNTDTRVTESTVYKINTYQTLVAKWTANTYTVSFVAGEGTTSRNNMVVTFDQPYGSLPSAERNGYDFVGWSRSSMGECISSSEYYRTTSNETLYAQWKAKHYKVVLDANGGSCGQELVDVEYKGGYVLPDAKRDYYDFTGWYNASGEKVAQSGSYNQASDLKVHAEWKEHPIIDWTEKSQVPSDAKIEATKWTYKKVEYLDSYNGSESGWFLVWSEPVLGDYGPWSGWTTDVYGENDIRQVETKTDIVNTWYTMDYYCTRTKDGARQFRNYSIGGQYSAYGVSSTYGEHHGWNYYNFVIDQATINGLTAIAPGGKSSGSQWGYNKSSDSTGYVINSGDNTGMIFFITDTRHEYATYYRYRDRQQTTLYHYNKETTGETTSGRPSNTPGVDYTDIVEYVQYRAR